MHSSRRAKRLVCIVKEEKDAFKMQANRHSAPPRIKLKVCLAAALLQLLLLLAANLIWTPHFQVAAASGNCQPEGHPNCVNNSATASEDEGEQGGRFPRASSLDDGQKTHVKIGILLEESNYEQANMFIRTIKMINEQRDETIGLLLAMFAASQRAAASAAETSELRAALKTPQDHLANKPARSRSRWRRRHEAEVKADAAQELLDELTKVRTTTAADRSRAAEREEVQIEAAAKSINWLDEEKQAQTRLKRDVQAIYLEPVIEFLSDRQSALEADEKVCQLVASGVRVIMGPLAGQSIQHVQSICDTLELPYFELRPFIGGAFSGIGGGPLSMPPPPPPSAEAWRAEEEQPEVEMPIDNLEENQRFARQAASLSAASSVNKLEELTLNLHPPSQLLNAAYIDLIYALNWTSFAIVYENDDSMIRLQDIFKESSPAGSWANKWRIRLFRHDPAGLASGDDEASTSPLSANNKRVPTNVINSPQVPLSVHSNNNSSNHQASENDQNSTPPSSRRHNNRPLQTGTFRDVFWRLKLSGEHNVLLDVSTGSLYEALKSAQQVGCMTDEFSYLVTSLDLHVIDLEDFKYSRTKITSLSLLQVAKLQQSMARSTSAGRAGKSRAGSDAIKGPFFDEKYLETLGVHSMQAGQSQQTTAGGSSKLSRSEHQRSEQTSLSANKTYTSYTSWMNEAESNDQTRRELLQSSPASLGLLPTVDRNNEQRLLDFFLEQQERNLSRVRLTTASALLHDSLVLLALGLEQLDPNNGGADLTSTSDGAISCSPNSAPWQHGSSLVNYMRQTSYTGLTGRISFDQRGLRNDFKLDIMGMAPNIRLVKIGEWHSKWAHEDARAMKFHLQPAKANFRSSNGQRTRGVAESREEGKEDEQRETFKEETSDSQGEEEEEVRRQPSVEEQTSDEFKSYDELSSRYESELEFYTKQLKAGKQVHVPYTKRVSPSGALLVNEIIFERLYREQADKVDTLVVTAKLSQPYFMLKETPNKLDGNDQYEGYAVDLIHELAKLVNFKYKWREVGDKKYGSKEVLANGTIVWNGMIGEIVRGQADLAIVDLTITAQREEAVDFTLPFMNTGISILFKKPTTKVTTLFSFLSPFSSDVWAYVLAAYCGISAILFLVGHLSPYEWADPHPCRHLNPDSELTVLKNQFSLLNSFWFTIGSLMQQGSDLTPRSMSTRTIAGIWYFFTLIMISSYTANLAAFLTVEKVVYPIENVRDLGNQQEIKYGCVESGSTCLFFQDSQIDTYKRIDETMRRHRTYVRSNDEGQKRVGEGKFAFFMESTTIEYIIERNCNLTQIGGLIDSKGYGLATSKKSRHKRPYRTLLNEGILHLQETGMLHVLKNRWWKEKRGGGTCTDDGKGGGVTELSLANVGGVFVVLLGGLGISFLVAIAEFIWRARRSGSTRDRMCEEMMNDLKFALACKSSTKPISKSGNGNNFKRRKMPSQTASDDMKPGRQSSGDDEYYARYLQNGAVNLNQSLFTATTTKIMGNGQASMSPDGNLKLQKQLDQKTTGNGGKPCDPILLHAMLTMLAQQQQTQQQQPTSLDNQIIGHQHPLLDSSKRTTSQPYLAGLNNGPSSIEFNGKQIMVSHSATVDENLGRQLAGAIGNSRNASATLRHTLDYGRSFSDGELEDDERGACVMDSFESCEGTGGGIRRQQQLMQMGKEAASYKSGTRLPYHLKRQQSNQMLNAKAPTSDASRRRLLHAQQTIDCD